MNRPIQTCFPHKLLETVSEIGDLASFLQGREISFSITARRLMELGAKTALAMEKEELIELMKDRS